MSLDGQIIIVTGAARGIGLAAARRFAGEGARTVLVDRDAAAGQSAVESIRAAGGDALFAQCDVAVAEQVDRVIALTLDRYGVPTTVMNNAAVHQSVALLDMDLAEFSRVLSTNVHSVFLFTTAAARAMVAAGQGGSIINVSSVNARMATPLATAYAASKGAISAFTAAAAIALAPHGIRVNAIGPGTVATELAAGRSSPEVREMIVARTPLGRLARPEEIAGVAYFLAGEDSSYITGQTIFADGGRMALSFTMPRQ